MIRFLLLVFLSFIPLYCFSQETNWVLIYENDAEGNTIQGSKKELITNIRNGKNIKIAWISQRPNNPDIKVEHMALAKFTTILSDQTVFVQIEPIIGQTPDFKTKQITFKENLEWCLIAGSNGKSDTMMRNTITGEIIGHQIRKRGFKWYAEK